MSGDDVAIESGTAGAPASGLSVEIAAGGPVAPLPAAPRAVTAGGVLDPARVVALSDGVFAIILTLLVLDLRVPGAFSNSLELQNWLLSDGYTHLGLFFASFLLASFFWVGHRTIFSIVARVDSFLILLNVIFLMIATLIPFSTTLLGQYPGVPLAQQIYGAVLLALASERLLIFLYLANHPLLLTKPLPVGIRDRVVPLMAITPAVFLITTLLPPFFPTLSLAMFVVTPIIYVLLIHQVSLWLAEVERQAEAGALVHAQSNNKYLRLFRGRDSRPGDRVA